MGLNGEALNASRRIEGFFEIVSYATIKFLLNLSKSMMSRIIRRVLLSLSRFPPLSVWLYWKFFPIQTYNATLFIYRKQWKTHPFIGKPIVKTIFFTCRLRPFHLYLEKLLKCQVNACHLGVASISPIAQDRPSRLIVAAQLVFKALIIAIGVFSSYCQ